MPLVEILDRPPEWAGAVYEEAEDMVASEIGLTDRAGGVSRWVATGRWRVGPQLPPAGVGAFIGPLWEVVATLASSCAQEFYRIALSRRPSGEATRKAREAIREELGDQT